MPECVSYENYRFSCKDIVMCLGISLLLSGIAAWILYKSMWGIFCVIIIFPLCCKHYKSMQIKKRKKALLYQFKEGMQSLSVALVAGFSIENAWGESLKEMEELYGKEGYIAVEMRQISAGIRMNRPVEELLYQFAVRSECEDIIEFAEVFRFAKRSGGNLGKIIQNTIEHISEKMEIEKEIETVIAGKKMEQKIMNVVPVLLLAYLNLTSEEFLAPLYGNLFGVCMMSGAFLAYIGVLMLANKMIDIRV